MSTYKNIIKRVQTSKLVLSFLVVAGIATVGTVGMASAAQVPKYFSVPKPTVERTCYAYVKTGNKIYTGPGWQGYGFSSFNQCMRYVTTDQPTSRANCTQGWWFVYGFNNESQCILYLNTHGGGYGGGNGNGHGHHHHHHHHDGDNDGDDK